MGEGKRPPGFLNSSGTEELELMPLFLLLLMSESDVVSEDIVDGEWRRADELSELTVEVEWLTKEGTSEDWGAGEDARFILDRVRR
jgi:hypothetical protein